MVSSFPLLATGNISTNESKIRFSSLSILGFSHYPALLYFYPCTLTLTLGINVCIYIHIERDIPGIRVEKASNRSFSRNRLIAASRIWRAREAQFHSVTVELRRPIELNQFFFSCQANFSFFSLSHSRISIYDSPLLKKLHWENRWSRWIFRRFSWKIERNSFGYSFFFFPCLRFSLVKKHIHTYFRVVSSCVWLSHQYRMEGQPRFLQTELIMLLYVRSRDDSSRTLRNGKVMVFRIGFAQFWR